MATRISARAYAAAIGMHEDSVQEWCRNAAAGYPNPRLPKIAARKVGRDWRIDAEATDRMQANASGNPIERDLARAARQKAA